MSQRLTLVAGDLNFPVSFAFAPDGRLFFNERRTGRVRVMVAGTLLPDPVAMLPVVTGGERGLLGLALHPEFGQSPWLYVYRTTRRGLQTVNQVTRLLVSNNRAVAAETVVADIPAGLVHNGGILGFHRGNLFVTTGETNRPRLAQDPHSPAGKVLRFTPAGAVPADNPIPTSPVFTLGHRNVFGLAFHPITGAPFITENGPDRDDEINQLVPGGNYGWPQVLGRTEAPGFIDPLVTFTPVIAPTGAAFFTGGRYGPAARQALFLGDWLTGRIRQLTLQPPRFDQAEEIRPVVQVEPQGVLAVVDGPDGFLYFSTPRAIWRIDALA